MRTGQIDQTAGFTTGGERHGTLLENTADFARGAEKMIKMCVAPPEGRYLTGTVDVPPGGGDVAVRMVVRIAFRPATRPTSRGATRERVYRRRQSGLFSLPARAPARAAVPPRSAFAEGPPDWAARGRIGRCRAERRLDPSVPRRPFRTARPIYRGAEKRKFSKKVVVFETSKSQSSKSTI